MNYKLLILGIILGIVLSGLIYWVYMYVNKKSDPNDTSSTVGVTKNYMLDGPVTIPISRFKLKNFTANRFCIEIWLFINPNAVTGGSDSLTIFKIGPGSSPKIKLDLYKNTKLSVTISGKEYIITPSFFLQKWEQVIISIDQYLVDLYLDGKLMSSTFSQQKIIIPSNNDNITLPFEEQKSDYYVSGLNIKTTAMDPKTALQNYNKGKSKVNGSTNVSLALTKNQNVAKNFILF
jgi:hypothetical protein